MATSQKEEATDNKQDFEGSGAVQESVGEKSKPQEPAAVEAPAEKAAAEQGAEETQDQKAADDNADSEEKAETEAKPEAKEKAEVAEEKDKPEAEVKIEAEEKAKGEEKAKAEVEAAEEPKAGTEEKAEAETETKPEAEEKADAAEEKDKPEAEAKVESEEKIEAEEKTSVPEQSQESATGKISDTIQQMTQSPAVLPGESGKPTMGIPQGGNPAHISVSSGVCAKEIMQKEVVWANSEESVQQALTKMQQQDSGYIMVGQDGALEGIVSKSDITGATSIYLRPIFAKWHGPGDDATLQIKLKWIMSRPVRTVRPETPLATIIENMCRFGGRGLPVVDEQGKVQGLVTVFDIFRTLLNTSEDVSTVGKTAETPALT